MTAKKRTDPTIILGHSGQAYTVTVTERGLRIDIDEQHRIVYTSILSGAGYIAFEVEAVDRERRRGDFK